MRTFQRLLQVSVDFAARHRGVKNAHTLYLVKHLLAASAPPHSQEQQTHRVVCRVDGVPPVHIAKHEEIALSTLQ